MFYLNICQIDKHDLMYNNSNNLQILSEMLMKLSKILMFFLYLLALEWGLIWVIENPEASFSKGPPWKGSIELTLFW